MSELATGADPRIEVESRLRRIRRARLRLRRLCGAMEEEIAAIRRRYDGRIAALESRLRDLSDELEELCRAERERILPEGRSSLSTSMGEVGFRRAEGSIRALDGLSPAAVCERLHGAGFDELVRVTEAPDKPAVRKALREGRIDADALGRCGLRLAVGQDRFYYRVAFPELTGPGGHR